MTQFQEMMPIALDNDRELAAEIGLLLSCYAIIDLYIPHIFSVVSGQPKDAASIVLSRVRNNGPRIELIRALLAISDRENQERELNILALVGQATIARIAAPSTECQLPTRTSVLGSIDASTDRRSGIRGGMCQ